jgi:hypothetical protein
MTKRPTAAPTPTGQATAAPEEEEERSRRSHSDAGNDRHLTEREHLQQLESWGFVGLWKVGTDIGDSSDFARRLRVSVESRADRYDEEEPAA